MEKRNVAQARGPMAAQVNISAVVFLSDAMYFKISIFTVTFSYYFLYYLIVNKHVMCE